MPIDPMEEVLRDIDLLKKKVRALEEIEASPYIRYATTNVSNPPTDAELDTAFGQPSTVGKGFIAVIDDNNANTTFWLVLCNGTSWQYVALTKAV